MAIKDFLFLAEVEGQTDKDFELQLLYFLAGTLLILSRRARSASIKLAYLFRCCHLRTIFVPFLLVEATTITLYFGKLFQETQIPPFPDRKLPV